MFGVSGRDRPERMSRRGTVADKSEWEKPLSDRALAVLMAIRERTEEDGRFWVPGAGRGLDDRVEELDGYVNISGGGDAAVLRSLAGRGLIAHRGGNVLRYAYAITEDGRQAVERAREKGQLGRVAEAFRKYHSPRLGGDDDGVLA